MRSTILQPARPIGRLPLLTIALVCASLPAVPAHAQTRSDDDPFAAHAWHLELGAHKAFETWNYNTSREEMIGLLSGMTYGLGKGLVLTARSQLYYIDQRGVDAWLLGATAGVRGRLYRKGRTTLYFEVEVGISEADTIVPPRGTRFNYLALGGGGATVRVGPGLHVLTGLRWIHVSNGGRAGRSRNPDIEAVGLVSCVLMTF